MAWRCDGSEKCANPLAYVCFCGRCEREEDAERFHACAHHTHDAEARHLRIRGHFAVWEAYRDPNPPEVGGSLRSKARKRRARMVKPVPAPYTWEFELAALRKFADYVDGWFDMPGGLSGHHAAKTIRSLIDRVKGKP